ncbi:ornithine cyclodeaminase family protein [Halorhabdus sp. CUG00001]|uniref:ornithine cyclodeaminase family protein n=1 Tax=Halorhabdus sp. CUG00001 TaxID=2600297 RepID=UPI00131AFAE1|nr:ornithine cyclodeaminase family protein [Halorhabdus sp. CUG00001]
MAESEALFLESEDVSTLATPSEYVAAVRDGYRQRGEGAPAEPRTTLRAEDPPGMLTGYLAVLPDSGVMGGYTYAAGFGERDAHFVLPVFDADSGEPLAVFDGASLNPHKTGAVGAVGIDALARENATQVGLFGSGSQASGQLRAAAAVRDLEQVHVYSPTPAHREAFAKEMGNELDPAVRAVTEPKQAVVDADIVITATQASEPVFDGEWLEPGTHVTAMGQYHPEKREIDAHTVAKATYVPDLRARLEQDAGAYLQAKSEGAIDEGHVQAELGDIVAGNAPGRTSDREITVFDSGGTAIETVAAAGLLYERARKAGVGESISFAPASDAM